jgi:hypothetical protein
MIVSRDIMIVVVVETASKNCKQAVDAIVGFGSILSSTKGSVLRANPFLGSWYD